jgi:hypothetical protein
MVAGVYLARAQVKAFQAFTAIDKGHANATRTNPRNFPSQSPLQGSNLTYPSYLRDPFDRELPGWLGA